MVCGQLGVAWDYGSGAQGGPCVDPADHTEARGWAGYYVNELPAIGDATVASRLDAEAWSRRDTRGREACTGGRRHANGLACGFAEVALRKLGGE